MKRAILYTFTALLLSISSLAQTLDKKEFKRMFLDAEYYFLFENYDKALDIYLEIFDKDSYQAVYNANLNYRIGFCYLQDPVNSYHAYSFLETASKNITLNYKAGSATETQSPPDVFLYLGNAYRDIFDFDKAIYAYQKYDTYLEETDIENKAFIKKTIQSCKTAKDILILSDHNFVEAIPLESSINTDYPEYYPAVSGNEDILVFTSRRNYKLHTSQSSEDGSVYIDPAMLDEDIYYSRKTESEWSKPVKISERILADYTTHSVSLSHDGTTLIVAKTDVGFGNIEIANLYFSTLSNSRWSELQKFPKEINTKGWEAFGCLSPDNKTLFFSSDREGGYGGTDIWKSELVNGAWTEAVNLGPEINSEFNEESPVILPDAKTMFFSSQGHYNMGGYDIFYSKLGKDGRWSIPLNVGFPINTMEDNRFFYPVGDGTDAYISIMADEKKGLEDIYKIKISSGIDFSKFADKKVKSLAEIFDENKGENKLRNKISKKDSSENEQLKFEIIDTKSPVTYAYIIDEAYKDVEKLLAKAREYRKEADIAYLIAEEKNLLAMDKKKEADELMKNLDTISDSKIRVMEMQRVNQIYEEAELLSVIAYNLAKKLDGSSINIKAEAQKSKELADKLAKDSLANVNILAEKLNNRRKELNVFVAEISTIDKDLDEQKNNLAAKARKLEFHQNNLQIIREEIHFIADTIKVRENRVAILDERIKSETDENNRILLADQREEIIAQLKYLYSEYDKLNEKQFNTIATFDKLANESDFLKDHVDVLATIDYKIKSNNEPIAAIAEKATLARMNLEKSGIADKKITISPFIDPDDIIMMIDEINLIADAAIKEIDNTLSFNESTNSVNNTNNDGDLAAVYYADNKKEIDDKETVTNQSVAENNANSDNAVTSNEAVSSENNANTDGDLAVASDTDDKTVINENESVTDHSVAENNVNSDNAVTSNEAVNSENNANTDGDLAVASDTDDKTVINENESVTDHSVTENNENSNNAVASNETISSENNTNTDGDLAVISDTENKTEENLTENTTVVEDNPVAENSSGKDNNPNSANNNKTESSEVTPAKTYVLSKMIFFDFGKADLSSAAVSNLDKLVQVMKENKLVTFEVIGYTDAKGDAALNQALSEKRAENAIRYITSKGISRSRLAKKAGGAANFIAVNTNPDGSDNPEGRQYNRRVEINLLSPASNIQLQTSELPSDLMAGNTQSVPSTSSTTVDSEMIWTIQVKALRNKVGKNIFTGLSDIQESKGPDAYYRYTTGTFDSYEKAKSYLDIVKKLGFEDAFVTKSKNGLKQAIEKVESSGNFYTIQVKAARRPVKSSELKDLQNVKEYVGNDGYYRYAVGKYVTKTEAERELKGIVEKGFADAFLLRASRYDEK